MNKLSVREPDLLTLLNTTPSVIANGITCHFTSVARVVVIVIPTDKK